MSFLRNLFRQIVWRLRSIAGLPGRTDAELMHQINRLPTLRTPSAVFKIPWRQIEYSAPGNLRAQFLEIFARRQYSFHPEIPDPVIIDGGGMQTWSATLRPQVFG